MVSLQPAAAAVAGGDAGPLVSREARAARALARQLRHQEEKAARLHGSEREFAASRKSWAEDVLRRIEGVQHVGPGARVLEVGSGAHGLVFFLDFELAVGVDPLAVPYRRLFPHWQGNAPTVAAAGEHLPFADASFDLVLCDNVVDHAENPAAMVRETARVLRPGGLLYLTVNVHHPLYGLFGRFHAGLNDLGPTVEVGPFADHTVHLTPSGARALLAGLPLEVRRERLDTEEARESARRTPPRHAGDLLKRIFFKNAPLEIIARRG